MITGTSKYKIFTIGTLKTRTTVLLPKFCLTTHCATQTGPENTRVQPKLSDSSQLIWMAC